MQVKLLRVLQESELTQVGESKPKKIDIRLIAATNVDLEGAIQNGDFREDLFYRISVLPIQLPPLRDRHGDVPILITHFLDQLEYIGAGMTEDFWQQISGHSWPGNIRELENLVTRLSVMIPSDTSWSGEHVKSMISLKKSQVVIPFDIPDEGLHLDTLMRTLVKSALHKTEGNQSKAAKLLAFPDQL